MRKWKKKARPIGVYILYILVILAFLTPIYWVNYITLLQTARRYVCLSPSVVCV